ncbi:uncharacterized protein TRIADDRAFT_55743 [Trichoplax adhaerens]|uniref:NAD(+) diphosphatase n=1 Tax=Trichoplax adhaerens TaxID=10228 RepID=B3RVR0_TRIAD|nr:hypothetical protein TRIADDRAFT_55743 [Trichoplax adhaerens]EDV26038.1 hypothetical protein TRIADDRAFT_55743 [Trichoplax adhaerens]|eukprot:XP_002112071.1 hypothetical protein TRIADDRAFT_55743 [Trichoplax adhaerens]
MAFYWGRCFACRDSTNQIVSFSRYFSPIQYRSQSTAVHRLTLQQYRLREELERDHNQCRQAFLNGKFAIFNGNKPYMTRTDRGNLLMTKVNYQDVQKLVNMDTDNYEVPNFVFLGLHDNRPFFAIDALSLIHFHKTISYCSRCGNKTYRYFSGSRRYCMNCRVTFYPQVSPVVAALVIRDGECLLARQPSFPEGLYSGLAGFCEPGESLEECARREVAEEIGVLSETVEFQGTQGWTLGIGDTSLMIGCYVTVDSSAEININGLELEDAKWFTRQDVKKLIACTPKPIAINGLPVFIPPPVAIAHQLLSDWANKC